MFLDPVMNPLLTMHPFVAILLLSVVLTLLSTIVYKYTTNQKRMKELRDEMKKSQEKLKKLMKTSPEKAMKLQNDMMGKNMELMKASFKPMLYTFIPLIIVFAWMNGHLAYHPLAPETPFEVTVMTKDATGTVFLAIEPEGLSGAGNRTLSDDKATWSLKGAAGEYMLLFEHNGETAQGKIIISDKTGVYESNQQSLDGVTLRKMVVKMKTIRPLDGVPVLGSLNWLWTYILLSFGLSFGLRKALGVV